MKFAANLSHLWADIPWADRFDAAATAGFTGVEALFPYDAPAAETQTALRRNNLSFVLLNAPPPNYTGGERGFAAIPGREARFAHDMRRAFRYATALGAQFVHVMSGVADGSEAHETMVSNLQQACQTAPDGVTLTIEPLNSDDMPGYYLCNYARAAELIEAVGAPNLGLQFDSYHAQMITGDACGTLRAFAPIIRHVQIGDAPGRVAPGDGNNKFAKLFDDLTTMSYDGWISAEYTPGMPTEKTLKWLQPLLA